MARGWESKSVEAQIEDSPLKTSLLDPKHPSPEERQRKRKQASLALSRQHVLEQLERSHNERYSSLLRQALTELDAKIAMIA